MGIPEGTGDKATISRANGEDVPETPSPGLAALFDEYSPAVYGLAAHILGNESAAEEVAEEVFVRAWRVGVDRWVASPNLPAPGSEFRLESDGVLNWLLRLAHALAIAKLANLRRDAPQPTLGTATGLPQYAERETPTLGIYDEASPEQRRLLARILWHGETVAALAQELGRTPRELTRDVRAAMALIRLVINNPTPAGSHRTSCETDQQCAERAG